MSKVELKAEDRALIERVIMQQSPTPYSYVAQNAAVEIERCIKYARTIARLVLTAALSDHRPPVEGEPVAWHLDAAQSATFAEALANPPGPNEALARAARSMANSFFRTPRDEETLRAAALEVERQLQPVELTAAPPSPPVEAPGVREAVERVKQVAEGGMVGETYGREWALDETRTFRADLRHILSALSTAPLSLGNGDPA